MLQYELSSYCYISLLSVIITCLCYYQVVMSLLFTITVIITCLCYSMNFHHIVCDYNVHQVYCYNNMFMLVVTYSRTFIAKPNNNNFNYCSPAMNWIINNIIANNAQFNTCLSTNGEHTVIITCLCGQNNKYKDKTIIYYYS